MEIENQNAYPVTIEDNGNPSVTHLGLTKREYFAAMAMQGMLSNITQGYGKPNVNEAAMDERLKTEQEFIDDVAIKSIRYSDALLKALETFKSEQDETGS